MNTRRFFAVLTLSLGLTLAVALSVLNSQAAPLLRPGNPVTDPVGNTHTAPPTTTVSITYDEPISPTTVSTRTFAVHAMQTGLLTQTYGVYSGTITLTPTQPFHPGELVQVSATTGTLGLDGTGPVSPTVWQFRVAVESGLGRFVRHGLDLGSATSVGVVLGDLDSDGDLDAFVANFLDQPNGVWRNDGTGTFTATQGLGSSASVGVALGDVDGDGDLDAFVANAGGQANKVWLNDGTGTFTDSGQSLGSSDSLGVALGDVDGDGDLDAFVTNYSYPAGQPNTVWLNDGTGTFSDSGQNLGSSYSRGVALGDLDGDGDLDSFVTNADNQADKVWMNDGTGTFTATQSLGGSISIGVVLGDVDGDGDLDALVVTSMNEPNVVWQNDGTGEFTPGQSLSRSYSFGVALGDVDGDGDLDAFIAEYGDRPNQVYLNDGAGAFTDSGQRLGSADSWGVALGDVDGDGDLDAFVVNYHPPSGQANTVWLNWNCAVYLPLVLSNSQ